MLGNVMTCVVMMFYVMVWYGIAGHDMVCYDVVWRVWYSMLCYVVVWYVM